MVWVDGVVYLMGKSSASRPASKLSNEGGGGNYLIPLLLVRALFFSRTLVALTKQQKRTGTYESETRCARAFGEERVQRCRAKIRGFFPISEPPLLSKARPLSYFQWPPAFGSHRSLIP